MPLPSVDEEVLRIADYCMDGKTLTHKDAVSCAMSSPSRLRVIF